MSTPRCPTCGILIETKAMRCAGCGARLHDGSTWPAPLQPLPAGLSGGALWLDDLGNGDGGADAPLPDLTLEPREIRQPLVPPDAALPTLRVASRPLARPPAGAADAPAAPPPLPRGAPLLPPVPPRSPRPPAPPSAALPAEPDAAAPPAPPVALAPVALAPVAGAPAAAAGRPAMPAVPVEPAASVPAVPLPASPPLAPSPPPATTLPGRLLEAADESPGRPWSDPEAALPPVAAQLPGHEPTPAIDWPVFDDLPELHASQLEPPIVLPAPEPPLPSRPAQGAPTMPPLARPSPVQPAQAYAAPTAPHAAARPAPAAPIRPAPPIDLPPPPYRRNMPPPAPARPVVEQQAPPLPTPLAPLYAESRRPPPAPVAPPAAEPPTDEQARRRASKVAARGAVRRARLQDVAAQLAAAPEILVLDRDVGARYELCALLQGFGFVVQATADTAEAAALAASGRYAAAFVDVALDASDGGAGIELCRRVRENNQRQGGSGTVLVLVASRLNPMDRVRADLAGCDEAIVKPVSRGSVARVLDERGIPLPSDARRVS